MANKIFKYPVPLKDRVILELPEGAKVLNFINVEEQPMLYAVVNTEERETEQRYFKVLGTGHAIKEDLAKLNYIGTSTFNCGKLVWHLFEMV